MGPLPVRILEDRRAGDRRHDEGADFLGECDTALWEKERTSRKFRKMAFLLRPELQSWSEVADAYKEQGFTDIVFEAQETFSFRETEFSLDHIEQVAPQIQARGELSQEQFWTIMPLLNLNV